MVVNYTCSKSINKDETWKAQISLLTMKAPYEMIVTARHSCFYMICGSYIHGNFLCIPNLGIASELANPTDIFWNLERFTMNHPDFSETDAISIIYGLKAISNYLEI